MKYIYQKRTLHSFPDYLKLKRYMYLQLQTSRLSLPFDEICSWLQLANSRPTYYMYLGTYLERTFIAKTRVVGLEFYIKNIKKEYLYIVSRTYRLQFVTLVTAPEQNNSLISYTVCPIYFLVLPLTLASRRERKSNKDKKPIILPFQTSYPPYR